MNKIKNIFLLLTICFISSICCGCYNYRELNQLAIASAIGIDKNEDGFELTIQIINTQKQNSDINASGDEPKFVTFSSTGKTLQECFRNVLSEAPRRIYADHIQILIFGEELAKSGIKESLDIFFRDPESRKQFLVVVTKNSKASDILKTLTPLVSLNAKQIIDGIKADAQYMGDIQVLTFEKLMANYLNKRKELSIPAIELIGDVTKGEKDSNVKESTPDTKIVLIPNSVFNDDQLIGYLSKEEAIALNFITNKIQNTIVNHKCDENDYFAVELTNSKTNTEASHNSLNVKIKVKATAVLNENHCQIDTSNIDTINDMEKWIEEDIKNNINSSFYNIIEKYNSDIMGFEDLFYKKNPKYYYTLKNDWNWALNNMKLDINVDVTITSKGHVLQVIE